MQKNASGQELNERLKKFCAAMNASNPTWDTAVILGKVNQYYFTGTMQDGLLLVKKDGSALYFVRRSFARAKDESPLKAVYPMESYGDAARIAGGQLGNVFIETEIATVGILERLKRKFAMESVGSLDRVLLSLRAVKSPFELSWMEESGRRHHHFLADVVPALLKEGVSEADFTASMFPKMVENGFQGMSRFSMFENEMVVGQIGFGTNSLYPTNFDGPGGAAGVSPAAPFLGSRERRLKRGDLVFVDIGFAVNGYNTDKTQIYMFGAQPSEEALRAHQGCLDVQRRVAGALKPGAIPSEIYDGVMESLSGDFRQNFMGFGARQVKFLGHGVGLHVDELPLIAPGYKIPLQVGMALAIEPKKGVPNVGMVGVEDTYLVEEGGGRCITGGGADIIVV
jgi:Xaa-Pro aminopeptidase